MVTVTVVVGDARDTSGGSILTPVKRSYELRLRSGIPMYALGRPILLQIGRPKATKTAEYLRAIIVAEDSKGDSETAGVGCGDRDVVEAHRVATRKRGQTRWFLYTAHSTCSPPVPLHACLQ